MPGARCELEWEPLLETALLRLTQEHFDAVLLDLDLGPTQGLATLARVQDQQLNVAVVVLTGRDDAETGVRAVQAGAQDYLTKGRADGDQVWRAVCYAVERHRAEHTIRMLNETLEHRVESRTQELMLANEELLAFVRSCAHDLRGPLRTVEGLVSLILEAHQTRGPKTGGGSAHQVAESADLVDLLERTRRAVARQDTTLSALTRFARTASTLVDVTEVDLAPAVRSLAEDLKRGAPNRKLSLRVPEHLPAFGDAGILHVALENLFSNAWKFTASREVAEIEIGMQTDRTPPAYFVRDNGVGFDPVYTERLFKPFQRLHDERTFPGLGLGLATVQRVARLHGGMAWAEAVEGRGATFYFTLAPEGIAPRALGRALPPGGELGAPAQAPASQTDVRS